MRALIILVVLSIVGCTSAAPAILPAQVNETVTAPLEEPPASDPAPVLPEPEDSDLPVPDGLHLITLSSLGSSMKLSPAELTISAGDTVRWVQVMDYLEGKAQVRVQDYYGEFRSPSLKYNSSYEHVFDKEGIYEYQIIPYSELFGRGKIIVTKIPYSELSQP